MLALVVFLVFAPGAAVAEQWSELRNVEPAEGKHVGWSLEFPEGWVRVPEIKPPLSDGFRSPDGKGWFVVSWAGDQIPTSELSSLEQKGFQKTTVRIGGHDGLDFRKTRQGGGLDRVVYARSPKGACRLVVGASADSFEPHLSRIVSSFRFQDVIEPPTKNDGVLLEFEGARLRHPKDWQVQRQFGAATLSRNNRKIVSLSTLVGPARGQAFRGFARSAGKLHIAGADKVSRFEPFRTRGGVTGYLAVWSLAGGGLSDLAAYLPLGRSKTLVATLHDSTHGDAFRSLIEQFQSTR